ncbi:ATP-binding cassette domain-containing protein [uncultured Clostridium sp.]|uniref:ABC transporter ATP-binding protein n=1 Tax=uncultured Clostridium sp. TaxID=59620 RepID=UPI0028ED9E03|nr:ATP-binding cassette domain-containing protein [uncultured Clostridium sp.]
MLSFSKVSYKSDDKAILKNIDIHIEKGDYISIVGHSGSGKSTFLKLCNNLISPSGGNISYKGKDILSYNPIELRKEINYCFQTPYLFGNKVIDNLSFPYEIRNKGLDIKRIECLCDSFNLHKKILDEKITNLSGGEKQRVALMRSLIFPSNILLLDEITSALDSENTLIIENIICKLNEEGITILWITHNKEQSIKYANKLLTIEDGSIKSLEVLK